jgi:transcriptional regulator with XRE-family HTH domain
MLKSEVNHMRADTQYADRVETMGDRIRTLRESRKLTQEDMGKIVGVSGASISQWESGATTGIRPENFLRFCAYFVVDPFWVVFGPDGDPQSSASGRFRRPSGLPRP